MERQRVLVVEGPAAVIHGGVGQIAEPEAEQNALLHPGIDPPSERARRVRLRRAHGARRQRFAQPCERGAGLVAIGGRARGSERIDLCFERHRRGRPASVYTYAVFRSPSSRSTALIFSFDSAFGGTIGRRYTSSSRPIDAIAA